MRPQWSPVFATGVTPATSPASNGSDLPQWSPVFATGVTLGRQRLAARLPAAAMESGLRDRGHSGSGHEPGHHLLAAMEPGLRDRGHRLQPCVIDVADLLAAM